MTSALLQSVLILGGTSDIGKAIGHAYAAAGWNVVLAARDVVQADRNASDIGIRHQVGTAAAAIDILDTTRFPDFLESLSPFPDSVVCVVGMLGEQPKAESDAEHAATVMRSNYEGPAILLGLIANKMLTRGSGTIIGISSVAGDRGRASNYVYGSAKAGFTAFLSGLRNRMAKAGLRVVTVKPGFVRTKMTAGMPLPNALTAAPEEVANAIFKKGQKGSANVIYVRPIWWLVMTIICSIPEGVFKKLSL